MPTDISDAIAMIATGSGYGKRALRTDADQFMMRVARPIILAGIPNDLADRDDLASRTIVLELPPLDEDRVKYEEEFWTEFEKARPRILGALLDGVAGALRSYQAVRLESWGRLRMSEFARWAEAGCRALGFREGEFLDAYVRNQARAMELAFIGDPLAQAVALLIEQSEGEWSGNTKPLHHELQIAATCGGKGELLDDERWPANPTWLGRELRKSAAVLRKVRGIEIEFDVDLRKAGKGDKDGLIIRKRV
jgi:putative DNA primase/helicase